MRTRATLGCLLGAAFAAPAMAATSTYTDVATCGGHDTHMDEFIYMCKGPEGLAAVLHYVEGKAFVVFGEGSESGEEIVGDTFNPVTPIPVGTSGKVFGPKIEWVQSDNGKVCAAIVRVETDRGSRLVTTALAGNRGRVTMSKTNEQARASAAEVCDSSTVAASPSPADGSQDVAAVSSASGKDLLPLKHGIFVDSEISCREFGRAYLTQIHVANKYAMSFWGDSVNDAFAVGKIIEVNRDGDVYKARLDTEVNSPMGDFKGVVDQTFVISSPTTVQTDRGYGEATFRWCYNEIP